MKERCVSCGNQCVLEKESKEVGREDSKEVVMIIVLFSLLHLDDILIVNQYKMTQKSLKKISSGFDMRNISPMR